VITVVEATENKMTIERNLEAFMAVNKRTAVLWAVRQCVSLQNLKAL
jgi:hypothetical protein